MASTINSTNSGSGGLITTGDDSNELQIQTGDTTRMTITSGGNVGVGTTSPVVPLQVANASPAMSLNATGSITSGSRGDFNVYNSSISTCGYVRFGAITDNVGTDIQFANRPAGGSLTERMRIDSSGNVLIAKTSTGLGSTGVGIKDYVEISRDSNPPLYLDVKTSDGDLIWLAKNASKVGSIGVASGAVTFSVNSSERMRIDSSGNLLVGTTTQVGRITANATNSGAVETIFGMRNGGTGNGSGVQLSFRGVNNVGSEADYCYITMVASDTTAKQGYMAFSTVNGGSPTERMRVTSGGQLQIGSTNSNNSQILSVQATSAGNVCGCRVHTNGNAAWSFLNASGSEQGYISVNASSVAYTSVSDYRLKENIAPMTGALATVAQLNPVTYTWKEDGSAGQGFIAHELQAVVPDCVTGEKDAIDADGNPKYQGVDTSFLVATLTAAIQELKAENDALKARLDAAGL